MVNARMAEPMTRERVYRLRCYPSARQRRVLGRLFGASRFVWNWALARRTSAYQADQTRLNWVSLSREFTALRQTPETHWLAELPREPFNQVLRDQERAFQNIDPIDPLARTSLGKLRSARSLPGLPRWIARRKRPCRVCTAAVFSASVWYRSALKPSEPCATRSAYARPLSIEDVDGARREPPAVSGVRADLRCCVRRAWTSFPSPRAAAHSIHSPRSRAVIGWVSSGGLPRRAE